MADDQTFKLKQPRVIASDNMRLCKQSRCSRNNQFHIPLKIESSHYDARPTSDGDEKTSAARRVCTLGCNLRPRPRQLHRPRSGPSMESCFRLTQLGNRPGQAVYDSGLACPGRISMHKYYGSVGGGRTQLLRI